LAALVAHPAAGPLVLAALRRHGRDAGLAPHELPAAVVLAADPPSVADGTLTTSGKIARAALVARHGARLEASVSAPTGAADLSTAPTGEADPSTAPNGGTDLSLRATDMAGLSTGSTDLPDLASGPDGGLAARLARVASSLLGRAVTADEPLVDALDSLGAAALLAALTEELGRPLPLPAWFASRSLTELAGRLRPAGSAPSGSALVDEAARELARPVALGPLTPLARPLRTVLLTGATGFLGAHLLEELLASTGLRVVCLVRGASDGAARERLARACLDLGIERVGAALAEPSGRAPGAALADRVTVVAGDLAAPRLGLDEASCDELAASVDAVLHAGAVVSWLAPYAALRGANVDGTRTLLALCARRATPLHLVSTISTVPADGDEDTRLSLTAAASSPYALSKWLSEELARQAAARGLPLAIYRPAMIAPHSVRGTSNRLDFIHRYLVGSSALGCHLDLGARLDMTPVDFVARAIVALLTASPGGGPATHLVNVAQSMTYAELGRAMVAAQL
ncbi:MAG: NAD-dependent epimerase/dehydratase family protein, partial [Myxococcales bacterium]